MLVRKTLATLERGGFTGSLYVVVPSEEVVAYQAALKSAPVHCVILHCQKGLTRQRRFFRDQMLPNTEIVFIDDDVEAIKILTAPGKLEHCRNVNLLANFVFQSMVLKDCPLAGVYPMANRDWMRPTVNDSNAYVVGALYFCLNVESVVEPDQQELEDYARQLHASCFSKRVQKFLICQQTLTEQMTAGGLSGATEQ